MAAVKELNNVIIPQAENEIQTNVDENIYNNLLDYLILEFEMEYYSQLLDYYSELLAI